jgi:hypothetical protein
VNGCGRTFKTISQVSLRFVALPKEPCKPAVADSTTLCLPSELSSRTRVKLARAFFSAGVPNTRVLFLCVVGWSARVARRDLPRPKTASAILLYTTAAR